MAGIQRFSLSSASSSLLSGELGSLSHTIPKLTKRRQSNLTPRASKDVPSSHRYPPMLLCTGVRLGCISGLRLHLPISSRYWSASGVPLLGSMLMFLLLVMQHIFKFHMTKQCLCLVFYFVIYFY